MKALIKTGCLLALLPWLSARETATPVTGLHTHTPRVHALVGATVVTSPERTLENATVVIRNGLIESVGVDADIPSDARVWDLKGKTIYPGFIDAYSHYGMPAGLKPAKPRDPRRLLATDRGASGRVRSPPSRAPRSKSLNDVGATVTVDV